MTNKEAINWLINITTDIGKVQHQELWHYEQALSEIKEMLEVESEQKTERWIPVSEKVPIKKFNRYWICTNNGYQCQCRWTDDRYGIGVGGLEWGWHIMDVPQYSYVVAWRELPEPYKEVEYEM